MTADGHGTSDPTRRATAWALAASVLAGAARAGSPPRRIVSLNPCVDAILVRVADRDQVAALSHYSRDPASSSIGAVGQTYPVTWGTAEEIVALRPDLVLATPYSPRATSVALARLGVTVATVGLPNSVEESLGQVMQVSRFVGHGDRGQALVTQIRQALRAAAPPPGAPALSALIYQSGGFAVARDTLMDEMLRRAGFENAATRYGLKRTGNVPLEQLIADPPDVLLAGQLKPGAPTWADRVLAHPALAHISRRMHHAAFPQRLTFCGGPVLIETATMLAQVRREALEARG